MKSATLAVAADAGTPIVQFFRLLGPDNAIALCRSYRVGAVIELRFGVEGEPAVLSECVESHRRAMIVADEWRTLLTTTKGFVEP
jgi:hypothetical protein